MYIATYNIAHMCTHSSVLYNLASCMLCFALHVGLTGNEYLSTPLTPLMDKTTNVHVHTRPNISRTSSTASKTSNGRLYTYLSGSDGDIDDFDTEDRVSSSGVSSNPKRHWRRGSGSSVSSNELDDSHLQNTAVSQLSLSADEVDSIMPIRYTHAGNDYHVTHASYALVHTNT